jgi:hypothetical protein
MTTLHTSLVLPHTFSFLPGAIKMCVLRKDKTPLWLACHGGSLGRSPMFVCNGSTLMPKIIVAFPTSWWIQEKAMSE